MPPPPWLLRLRDRLKAFWRSENPRVSLLRDVLVVGLVILVVLGGIWVYSGQPLSRSPVVMVESGSMMHGARMGWDAPGFGRLGTIDPGDIVIVKKVDSWDDVEPAFGNGSRDGYGAEGDVIVYRPSGRESATRIIHRALLLVRAEPEGCRIGVDCTYQVPAACNPRFVEWGASPELASRLCAGTNETFDLSLRRGGLALDVRGYPACPGCQTFYSSLVTRGDNNGFVDQFGISTPVRLEWILGKARGEVPWLGMVKLSLAGNCGPGRNYSPSQDPTGASNWKILNGCAPWDVWVGFFLTVAVLALGPTAFEHGRRYWLKRRAAPPQR